MTPLEIARRAHADQLAARAPRELLSRYAAGNDAEAFAGLVHQFGPMVLGTCRRVLGQHADADDAFQLVFLALARSAGTFRDPAALPAWLHRVSLRVARKLRARRPPVVPAPIDPADPADPLADVAWKDLRRVLDDELDRLPEKYRAPLVLCWLDGLTQDEAVTRLGVPLTTLKRRLDAGRALLRNRLLRRGVAPALAAALVEPAGLRAVVTDELVAATLALASPGAAPPAGANAVIAAATESGSRGASVLAAVVLIVGTVAAGVFLTAGIIRPPVDRASRPTPPPPPAPDTSGEKRDDPLTPDPVRFDALGDPLPADARFRLGTDRFRVAPPVFASVVSPDGKRLAVTTPGAVTLLDLDTGRVLWRQPAAPPDPHPRPRATPGLAFAPDGGRVYARSFAHDPNDPTGRDRAYAVQVLDGESGRPLARFARPDKPTFAGDNILFANDSPGYPDLWFPDGSKHLFVRAGSELRALDPVTGQEVRRTPTPGWVEAVAPDGRAFVRVANPKNRIWYDIREVAQLDADGKEVRRYTLGHPSLGIVLSRDGTRLAHHGPAGVIVWDTATGAELRRGIRGLPLDRHGLTFTPDGRSLLSRSWRDYRNVVTVDISTGQQTEYRSPEQNDLHPIDPSRVMAGVVPSYLRNTHTDQPFVGQFYPVADGRSGVAVNNIGTVSRWELGDGTLKRLPDAGVTEWQITTRSANGRVLAVVHKDTGRIGLADGETGKPARTIRTGNIVYAQALSPDGKVLATLDPVGTFTLWDTATGGQKHLIARGVLSENSADLGCRLGGVAFSPDGTAVVVSTQTLGTAAYDVATGRRLWTQPVHPYPRKKESPPGARLAEWPAFSPDGHVLICEDTYHHPILRDARTGDPLDHFALGMFQKGGPSKHPHSLKGEHPAFSNGGGWLGRVQWEKFNPSRVVRVAHSAGASEFRLLPVGSKIIGANNAPFAFGPAGVWAASADGADVVIWDVATETPVRRLTGHRGVVTHIEWGHDGRTLISSAADRTSLVWDVKPKLPPPAADWADRWWDDLAGDGPTAFRAVWQLTENQTPGWIIDKFDNPARRPPDPAPDQLTPDYWRVKRAVLALELAHNALAYEYLRRWSGSPNVKLEAAALNPKDAEFFRRSEALPDGELLTEEVKAAFARLKLRAGQ